MKKVGYFVGYFGGRLEWVTSAASRAQPLLILLLLLFHTHTRTDTQGMHNNYWTMRVFDGIPKHFVSWEGVFVMPLSWHTPGALGCAGPWFRIMFTICVIVYTHF